MEVAVGSAKVTLSAVLVVVGAAVGVRGIGNEPAAHAAAPAQLDLQPVWRRTYPGVTFLDSSPVPANLTTPAYVVGGLDGRVYALDAGSGADEPGWPVTTTNPINSSPAAADVAGDGHSRIFIGSGAAMGTNPCSGGGTYAIGYRGNVNWHNNQSDADCASLPFQDSFAIGDVTGDGAPDATIGALGLLSPSYAALTGAMNEGWPFFTDDTVFSTPALDALSGAGPADVIMGGDSSPGPGHFRGGMMRAIDGAGHLLWQYDVDEQVASSPAVGDIGSPGHPAIVFGTGEYWLEHGGATDSDSIFVVDPSGRLVWRKDLGGDTYGSPALADVEGNGQADIVEGTNGFPGSPNSGAVWVLDASGNPLPGWAGRPSGGGVVIGGITTADLNGDGAQDLLVPTGAGVFIYDGRTAVQIGGIDIGQVSYENSPLVTDDGGGAIGITVAGATPSGTGVVAHYRVVGGQVGHLGWPMFHHDPAHTGNLATPAPACVASAAGTPPTGKVTRLAGAGRDATGVAVSRSSFPSAGSAGTVVLASDANYPDALSGGPLASADHGPMLITPPGALSPAVDAEIRRVLPTGTTVHVVGGSAALSAAIDSELRGQGYLVDRLEGPDRFGTAVAVADELGDPGTVLEVTGDDFPDALAAGPAAAGLGAAILLTDGVSQDPATAAYLSAHPGTRYAIGGPAAAADPTARAVSGTDRYATAVAVAKAFSASPSALAFATGTAFADALTGGPGAALRSAPLLLVPACGALPAGTGAYITAIRSSVGAGILFGGTGAVGDDVLAALDKALA
jgi:putative cell wall-binding protein